MFCLIVIWHYNIAFVNVMSPLLDYTFVKDEAGYYSVSYSNPEFWTPY